MIKLLLKISVFLVVTNVINSCNTISTSYSDQFLDFVKDNAEKKSEYSGENFGGVYVFQVYPIEVFVKGEQSFEFRLDNTRKDSFSQVNFLVIDSFTHEVYYRPIKSGVLYKKDDTALSEGFFDFNLIKFPGIPDTINIHEKWKNGYLHDLYGTWDTTSYKKCDLKLNLQLSNSSKKDTVTWFLKRMENESVLRLKYVNASRSIYPSIRFYGKNNRLFQVDSVFSFPIDFARRKGQSVKIIGGVEQPLRKKGQLKSKS